MAEVLDADSQQKTVILILGGPGMGKSTLAINICKQWAEGSLLQCYDAVVLLLLRDQEVQGAKTIKDLLQTLNDDLRENVYKLIAKCNEEKICFIFEGYDELPYHLQKAFVFTKLIELLPKCTHFVLRLIIKYHKIIKLITLMKSQLISTFQKHLKGIRMERKWHKIGLWELYSKFLSLFYSEFLLQSLHYAQFYSFYAYDYHYSPLTSKFLNTLAINKTFSSLCNITLSVFVTYFFQITNLPVSSTVPEVEMSLFCSFLPIFLSGNSFILTYYAQYFTRSFNILLKV